MALPNNWAEILLNLTKATKKEVTVLFSVVCVAVIIWLVQFIIVGKEVDCDKLYNRLESLYTQSETRVKYLEKDKEKLLILNDSLYRTIFKLNKEKAEYEYSKYIKK